MVTYAATRIGDADIAHCSGMVRAQGSGNVFVNGKAWSCETHKNSVHLKPGVPCPSHAAPIDIGSTTVFVNGKGAGSVGDALTGCTQTAAGSPNVFIGK